MSMHNSKMAYDKNEEYKAIPIENLPRYLLNRRTARLNCPNIVEQLCLLLHYYRLWLYVLQSQIG